MTMQEKIEWAYGVHRSPQYFGPKTLRRAAHYLKCDGCERKARELEIRANLLDAKYPPKRKIWPFVVKGRTGDRGRIPEVSDKVLPVYFRQSIQNLKEQMMQGEDNPLNLVFVVDVHVQRIDGEPKGYTVVEIHESNQRDDE